MTKDKIQMKKKSKMASRHFFHQRKNAFLTFLYFEPIAFSFFPPKLKFEIPLD
jgi:hypothetical protein